MTWFTNCTVHITLPEMKNGAGDKSFLFFFLLFSKNRWVNEFCRYQTFQFSGIGRVHFTENHKFWHNSIMWNKWSSKTSLNSAVWVFSLRIRFLFQKYILTLPKFFAYHFLQIYNWIMLHVLIVNSGKAETGDKVWNHRFFNGNPEIKSYKKIILFSV